MDPVIMGETFTFLSFVFCLLSLLGEKLSTDKAWHSSKEPGTASNRI